MYFGPRLDVSYHIQIMRLFTLEPLTFGVITASVFIYKTVPKRCPAVLKNGSREPLDRCFSGSRADGGGFSGGEGEGGVNGGGEC